MQKDNALDPLREREDFPLLTSWLHWLYGPVFRVCSSHEMFSNSWRDCASENALTCDTKKGAPAPETNIQQLTTG